MDYVNRLKSTSPRCNFKPIQSDMVVESVPEQAYLIPENNGTAVYLSYELNKLLENVFKKYTVSGYMGRKEFIKMCYDCNLLPKKTNKDILYYIFKTPNSLNNGYIEYKDFFQVLHRLSVYLFRKLIMTEQDKFNVLIKHLTVLKMNEELDNKKYSVGIQVSVEKHTTGVNAVCNIVESSCNTFIDLKNQINITEVIESKEHNADKYKETEADLSIENNGDTIKLKSKSNELEVNQKIKETELNKKIKEIEIECNKKEEINKKLNEEINSKIKIIEEKNIEIQTINKNNLRQLKIQEEKTFELNNQIKKLQEEKCDLETKLKEVVDQLEQREKTYLEEKELLKEIEADYLKLKKLLILPCEEESKLIKIFSHFSVYNGEASEYVITKKCCAEFLVTYYLLGKDQKNLMAIDTDRAEKLFVEVINKKKYIEQNDSSEDILTYFYFKLFLCNTGNFIYPDLTEKESFLEIVLNHILRFNKNLKLINKKAQDKKMKLKSLLRAQNTNELSVLSKDMESRYTSSNQNSNSNELKKYKNSILYDSLTTQNEKSDNDYLDQSFEYIESNETRKKKKKRKEKKRKNRKERSLNIGDYLNQNVEYKGMYGYDVSSVDYNSLSSNDSEYFHLYNQEIDTIKSLNGHDSFIKSPKQILKYSKIINTNNNHDGQNKSFLYDIEDEILLSQIEKKKKSFLPVFGNE